MNPHIVDTNVILVANGAHRDISPECVIACVKRLDEIMKAGVLVLDDQYEILAEYQQKTTPRKAKGPGDVFVKWALSNIRRANLVHQVSLKRTSDGDYSDFPEMDPDDAFDSSDKKFVAAAQAHPEEPPILQASDCKWLGWWQSLRASNVRVEFLCAQDVCRFYGNKFPDRELPPLP